MPLLGFIAFLLHRHSPESPAAAGSQAVDALTLPIAYCFLVSSSSDRFPHFFSFVDV